MSHVSPRADLNLKRLSPSVVLVPMTACQALASRVEYLGQKFLAACGGGGWGRGTDKKLAVKFQRLQPRVPSAFQTRPQRKPELSCALAKDQSQADKSLADAESSPASWRTRLPLGFTQNTLGHCEVGEGTDSRVSVIKANRVGQLFCRMRVSK